MGVGLRKYPERAKRFCGSGSSGLVVAATTFKESDSRHIGDYFGYRIDANAEFHLEIVLFALSCLKPRVRGRGLA
jgi:hypothetical protein